jgi:mRNA-degrading endonuclease RelE of RelBE toxin-antitoxin system
MPFVIALPKFVKQLKKLSTKMQEEVQYQIYEILENPEIGEKKKGDLSIVRVHKFKIKAQLYLLAYRVIDENIYLYSVDTHENFYRDLKKYLKP